MLKGTMKTDHSDPAATPVVQIKLPWTMILGGAATAAIFAAVMWASVNRLTERVAELTRDRVPHAAREESGPVLLDGRPRARDKRNEDAREQCEGEAGSAARRPREQPVAQRHFAVA